jgi:hypothetical protein
LSFDTATPFAASTRWPRTVPLKKNWVLSGGGNGVSEGVALVAWLTWYYKNCPSVIRGWRSAQLTCLHLSKLGAPLYPEHFLNEAQEKLRMVTAEQKATMSRAATKAGLDVSGWARFVLLREANRP